jgi:hypothetical protein
VNRSRYVILEIAIFNRGYECHGIIGTPHAISFLSGSCGFLRRFVMKNTSPTATG